MDVHQISVKIMISFFFVRCGAAGMDSGAARGSGSHRLLASAGIASSGAAALLHLLGRLLVVAPSADSV